MTAVNGVTARRTRATSAVVIARGSEQVVAEAGKVRRRIGNDERGVVRVGLVPEVSALKDMRCAAASPITAAMRHEKLAVLVVIQAPLVAAAVREHFELVPHGMIPPHARSQFDPLRVR